MTANPRYTWSMRFRVPIKWCLVRLRLQRSRTKSQRFLNLFSTFEQKRGRIEARTYHALSADDVSKAFPQWPELKTIGMSMSFRQQQGKAPELTYRYNISSASLSEKQLAEAVPSHWAVENSLHWVLDVSMGEDDCQIHLNHGAENWSMLRHLALNMLRAESSKGSIPAKQKRAWMKASYLEAVLTAGFSSMVD